MKTIATITETGAEASHSTPATTLKVSFRDEAELLAHIEDVQSGKYLELLLELMDAHKHAKTKRRVEQGK